MNSDNDYILLNGNNVHNYHKKSKVFTIIERLLIIILISLTAYIFISFNLNKNQILKDVESENFILEDFELVNDNDKNGPITVNKLEDDGTKSNIYLKIINIHNDTFSYEEDEFNKLENIINKTPEYLCEYHDKKPSESFEGYILSCPTHYTISINSTFYGRHKGDSEHCISYPDGRNASLNEITAMNDCGVEPLDILKELCEDRKECHVIPCNAYFGKEVCLYTYKYLYVDYYCKKDKEMKKPKIMVNMFANEIEVNSVYENAISEFYQYSKYHGYKFLLNTYRYDTEREIYYMKLNMLIENLIKCLKEKSYDWIFWVDSDVVLINPNIKLETFLPNEKMDLINFIGTIDFNGFNGGVFFIRVHPWSLNFLMRASTYFYYNQEDYLLFADQSSMNNVLTSSKDTEDHYIIVPQYWFNSHIDDKQKGEFLVHLAGQHNKTERARKLRSQIEEDPEWYTSVSSKDLRKKVLEYYDLPKEQQKKIKFETERTLN